MTAVAVDWDDTLVDAKTQEWLPGAVEALRTLLTQFQHVIVYTAHANWPEGHASVEAKIEEAISKPWYSPGVDDRLSVYPKPLADVYVDDRAVRFTGDWAQTLADIAAGSSPKPAPKPVSTEFLSTTFRGAFTSTAPCRPTFPKRK